MKSDFAALTALGAISGAAAWASMLLMDSGGIDLFVVLIGPLSLVPGLVFGLVIGFPLRRRGRFGAARQVGYVFAAGLGYFVAFHVAIYSGGELVPWVERPAGLLIGGVLGGLAGSALLGGSTVWLLRVPAAVALRRPVVTGSVAGGLLPLLVWDNAAALLAFLVLWQGAYAASLAPLLRLMRAERS